MNREIMEKNIWLKNHMMLSDSDIRWCCCCRSWSMLRSDSDSVETPNWGIDCCLASAWRPQTTTRITGVSFRKSWWPKLQDPTGTFTATLNATLNSLVHLYQALEDVTHAPAQISQKQKFKKLTALRRMGVKQANEVCLPVDICTTTGRSQSGKNALWSDASLAGRSPY